jgi:endonuclease YncB( thermonuclease family)
MARRWWIVVCAVAIWQGAAAGPGAAQPAALPRLVDDGQSLLLQDASASGEETSAVQVLLRTEDGRPIVQLRGPGLAGHWRLAIACPAGSWPVQRFGFEGGPDDATALFRVPPEAVEAALGDERCRLEVPGRSLRLPTELAAAVWGRRVPVRPPDGRLTARALWVVDGETVGVQLGDRVEIVRYAGIIPLSVAAEQAAPPGASSPTAVNRALVGERELRIEAAEDERDPVGRLQAYVWVGDSLVNAELVRQGYARTSPGGPNLRYRLMLARLEEEARREGRGLWPTRIPGVAEAPAAAVLPVDADRLLCPPSHPVKAHSLRGGAKRYYPAAHPRAPRVRADACYQTEVDAALDGYVRTPR